MNLERKRPREEFNSRLQPGLQQRSGIDGTISDLPAFPSAVPRLICKLRNEPGASGGSTLGANTVIREESRTLFPVVKGRAKVQWEVSVS